MKLTRFVLVGCVACVAACGAFSLTWTTRDACDDGACTPCESDDDCRVSASCCGESFTCGHVDDLQPVCQLGCDIPPGPACTCVGERCTASN